MSQKNKIFPFKKKKNVCSQVLQRDGPVRGGLLVVLEPASARPALLSTLFNKTSNKLEFEEGGGPCFEKEV